MNYKRQLKESFTHSDYQSGLVYEKHSEYNKQVIHTDTTNTYFSMEFPSIKGGAIELVENSLIMRISQHEHDYTIFQKNERNIYTIRKVDVNLFRVLWFSLENRNRILRDYNLEKEVPLERTQVTATHYTYKYIYHLFGFPVVDNIETILNFEHLALKP